jgi:hypothetical protein
MPRDPTAITIQGPDNGSGNPIIVTTGSAAPTVVDIQKIGGYSINIPGGFNAALPVVGKDGAAYQSVVGAANTAVVITLPALVSKRHHLTHLSFGYQGANTQQTLTVADNVTTVLNWLSGPANSGMTTVPLPIGGIQSAALATTMTITLPAGGAGVVGILNIANWDDQ